jgi:hypothetical protein
MKLIILNAFALILLTFHGSLVHGAEYTYITNGTMVRHNTDNEFLYYATPATEVAYNTQIIRLADVGTTCTYITYYHSEAHKPSGFGYPGDSVKCGVQTGPFTFKMPASYFALSSTARDPDSLWYSAEDHSLLGWGGTGNPMLIKGVPGDPYFYSFSVSVVDDNRDRQGEDFRHCLCQTRTLDFKHWEVRTAATGAAAWQPLTADASGAIIRPVPVTEISGKPVLAIKASAKPDTQGLIGSMSYVQGKYYFFYTDRDPQGATHLYCRTADNVARPNAWSPAQCVNTERLMEGAVVRVAKAHGADRWALLYNGYRLDQGKTHPDLMLQYTQTLDLDGPQGVAGIRFYEALRPEANGYQAGIDNTHGLHLAVGQAYAQHFFLTDAYGNLALPEETQTTCNDGFATWSDLAGKIYGAPVYLAGWSTSPAAPSK